MPSYHVLISSRMWGKQAHSCLPRAGPALLEWWDGEGIQCLCQKKQGCRSTLGSTAGEPQLSPLAQHPLFLWGWNQEPCCAGLDCSAGFSCLCITQTQPCASLAGGWFSKGWSCAGVSRMCPGVPGPARVFAFPWGCHCSAHPGTGTADKHV